MGTQLKLAHDPLSGSQPIVWQKHWDHVFPGGKYCMHFCRFMFLMLRTIESLLNWSNNLDKNRHKKWNVKKSIYRAKKTDFQKDSRVQLHDAEVSYLVLPCLDFLYFYIKYIQDQDQSKKMRALVLPPSRSHSRSSLCPGVKSKIFYSIFTKITSVYYCSVLQQLFYFTEQCKTQKIRRTT